MFSMNFKSWAYQKKLILDQHETEDIQRNTYLEKEITRILVK
jgi:hypothetical protein